MKMILIPDHYHYHGARQGAAGQGACSLSHHNAIPSAATSARSLGTSASPKCIHHLTDTGNRKYKRHNYSTPAPASDGVGHKEAFGY